jgi:hypothetical protein
MGNAGCFGHFQSFPSVDFRLARPQKIKIRTIEDQNTAHRIILVQFTSRKLQENFIKSDGVYAPF